MTGDLIQKLEDKIIALVSELESTRKELISARQENTAYKAEKNHHMKKIQELISFLDKLDLEHSSANRQAEPVGEK